MMSTTQVSFPLFGTAWLVRNSFHFPWRLTGHVGLVSPLPSRRDMGHFCTSRFPGQCRSSPLLGSVALAVLCHNGRSNRRVSMCAFRPSPSDASSRLFLSSSPPRWNSAGVFSASLAGQRGAGTRP
ncbi:hypothetical protein CGRA01v4_14626 [Colletotrichum graminicola]|nr:hypothetical protein CGRA01v4_14626 [Colletotrichum graminicola]